MFHITQCMLLLFASWHTGLAQQSHASANIPALVIFEVIDEKFCYIYRPNQLVKPKGFLQTLEEKCPSKSSNILLLFAICYCDG